MGNRHIHMRHRFSFSTSRFRIERLRVLVQFSQQIPGHLVCEETSVATGWLSHESCNAGRYFRAEGGELPTVLPNEGVEEILRFDVRSAAISRRPEGHEDQSPRPIRIPFKHGSIMRVGRRVGQPGGFATWLWLRRTLRYFS